MDQTFQVAEAHHYTAPCRMNGHGPAGWYVRVYDAYKTKRGEVRTLGIVEGKESRVCHETLQAAIAAAPCTVDQAYYVTRWGYDLVPDEIFNQARGNSEQTASA